MAQWDPALGRVRQVVVVNQHRNRGLATRLLRQVARLARQAAHSQLRVHAWQSSQQFYHRLGFLALGSAYRSGEKQVLCQVMEAPLNTGPLSEQTNY